MIEQKSHRHAPYDIECEQSVLGLLLVKNDLIDAAAADLEPEDFWDPLHSRLFQTICQLSSQGSVTAIVLHNTMRTDEGLKEVNGLQYLAVLAQSAPWSGTLPDLIRVLKDLSFRRRLLTIAEELAEDARESEGNAPALEAAQTAAEGLLRAASAKRSVSLSPYESGLETLREVEQARSGKPLPLVPTGLTFLDDKIGGLRGEDFIVVPGASGMGKSALLASFALRAAIRGFPAILFSLEMTRRQLTDRMVCDLDFEESGTPLWYSRFRTGRATEGEFNRYAAALQRFHGLPLEIEDADDLTIEQVSSRARAFKMKHGNNSLGIVLIDYLQIVVPSGNSQRNREQEVAHIARGAKKLAKSLGWPVVAGSQLNEDANARGDGLQRPRAGDVRESKVIRNEADLMLAPWREAHVIAEKRQPGWQAEAAEKRTKMELICLKNRHGEKFDLELFCEIAASVIRDEKPYVPDQSDRNAQALLPV